MNTSLKIIAASSSICAAILLYVFVGGAISGSVREAKTKKTAEDTAVYINSINPLQTQLDGDMKSLISWIKSDCSKYYKKENNYAEAIQNTIAIQYLNDFDAKFISFSNVAAPDNLKVYHQKRIQYYEAEKGWLVLTLQYCISGTFAENSARLKQAQEMTKKMRELESEAETELDWAGVSH